MTGALELGLAELADGRWEAARAALAGGEEPEALEALSWAAWWLDDADAVFDSRERAFRLFRRRGDPGGAARMAIWLACDELDFHGATAVASGWLQRARRLLEPLDPAPEHGWLAFHSGYLALVTGDSTGAGELAVEAAEIGRATGVPDLEMLGLALQGRALVGQARVGEGMRCLDEATVTALAAEAVVPISSAWTFCLLVSACVQVRDFRRAFEWCDRIADFADRYRSGYMRGFCRVHYGAVHLWRGDWRAAETELDAAVDDFSRSRPTFVPGALVWLAELRVRQGRADEAERLLDGAGDSARPRLCRARLALERGDAALAEDLAERCLRQLGAERRLDRAAALELLAQARIACGRPAGAAPAVAELRELARLAGTTPLRACADLAAGALAAASGRNEDARPLLEDAVDGLERSGARFDAALARLELASSLIALGRLDAAGREARIAQERLRALGADPAARRARRLLGACTPGADGGVLAEITPRERDVLRLLTQGLTNREIAERLVVSEHTVHRHVTSILRKLDLPSRTAAAAHAVRAGLGG